MPGMFEIMKNITQHIEEMAAAYYKKTNADPDKFKMVQRVTYGNENLILRLDTWFEPLGVEEIDIYRKRAEDAEAEVARLREAARWIPVGERLPEEKTYILIFTFDGFIRMEYYNGDLWFTHWMPLPEPPEVE